MKSGLTPEAEKELQNCLQWVEHMHRRLSVSSIETDLTIFRLFDPIISQSVLSYSFSSVDDWKLEPWKKIFTSTSSMVIDDFIISLKEIQSTINTVLRHSGALHILPPESLRDVSQSLVNNRALLLKNSVLAHASKSWDSREQSLRKLRNQNARLGPPKPETINYGFFHSTTRWLTPSIFLSPFISVSDLTDQRDNEYMIKVERRLPYNESFSTSGIDLEQSVIVVSFLETLVREFLSHVQSGSLRRSNVLSHEGHSDVAILPLPCVLPFLETRIRTPVTPDHVEIFVWFLTFLSPANCCPFECSLGDSKPSIPSTRFKAIKISFDAQHSDAILEISEADRAALLERFAEDMLADKLKELDQKIVAADDECKRHLKLKNQEAALRSLKKKKMAETQLESLGQQMLRVEEARQMRDATQSIGLVASVVQTAAKATRASVGDGQRVLDAMEDFQQSMDEVREVQEALGQATALVAGVSSESLEEEYNRLMAKEVEEALLDLGEVPKHPLPTALTERGREHAHASCANL